MVNGQTKLELEMIPSMQSFLRYKDLPYEAWFAVAELVDNSTQSYIDHKDVLGPKLSVRVAYDSKERKLTVYDEAMGMDEPELRRAVVLGLRPPRPTGRCEYGMGMKTSLCWMGRKWSITTKKLGVPFEYYLEVDVEELAKGTGRVFAFAKPAPKDRHYTIINVWEMYQIFRTKTLTKIKDFLAEIYRFDINEGWLDLKWNETPLEYELPPIYVETKPDGTIREWKKDFSFTVEGRKVTGWIGIMHPGDFSRSGFNCYRHKRLIKPRWKADRVFPPKPGHLLHQRLVGELFLDGFNVTHLKDDFKWDDVDPEVFCDALFEHVEEIREKATKVRFDDPEATQAAVEFTEEGLKAVLEDPSLIESLEVTENAIKFTPKETPAQRAEYLERLQGPEYRPISLILKYRGETTATVYFPKEASPNDPYLDFESTPKGDRIDMYVNVNHPFARSFSDQDRESFYMYVKMLVFEALSEWLLRREGKPNPTAKEVRMAKDHLLRTQEADVQLG